MPIVTNLKFKFPNIQYVQCLKYIYFSVSLQWPSIWTQAITAVGG